MKVTIVFDPELPNANHRALRPAEVFHTCGCTVVLNPIGHADLRSSFPDDPSEADAIFVHRYCDRTVRRAFRRWRDAGKAIIWDNDDDLTAAPGQRRLQSQQAQSEIRTTLQLTDAITTPNGALAASYRQLGATRVVVVENSVPDQFAHVRPRRHAGVVVGWVAAREHSADLRQLELRSTLRGLLDAHDEMQLACIGIDLGIDHPRYSRIDFVHYPELGDAIGAFDVGIAPLADTPFNRARSNVKLKEYAVVGVPWLASPVGPYRGMGEREGGRLVADHEWHDAISRLLTRPRERRKLAKRAARWGRQQTISHDKASWLAVLEAAVAGARARLPVG